MNLPESKVLRSAYLQEKSLWLPLRPQSARENRLLLVQGGGAEALHFTELGWQVEILAFAAGCTDGIPHFIKSYLVSPWATQWEIEGFKYHAVVIGNVAMADVLSEPSLLKRLLALLETNGQLHGRFVNSGYYGELFPRSGRELWPQDFDPPHASWYTIENLRSDCQEWNIEVAIRSEEMDSISQHVDFSKWQEFSGWETRMDLPQDPVRRKSLFLKNSHVVLSSRKQIAELKEDDLAVVHSEIEALLNDARLEEAGVLLDKLFQASKGNAQTCNLQGILQFYRGQVKEAWDSFRMAILLRGDRLEYYQNLADASVQADRVTETATILDRARGIVPGIEEIVPHA